MIWLYGNGSNFSQSRSSSQRPGILLPPELLLREFGDLEAGFESPRLCREELLAQLPWPVIPPKMPRNSPAWSGARLDRGDVVGLDGVERVCVGLEPSRGC